MGFMPQAFMLQPEQGKPCPQEIHAFLFYISSSFGLKENTTGNSLLERNSSNTGGSEAPVGSSEAGPDLQPSGAIWYLCLH